MARAAVERVAQERQVVQLKDITWVSPVVVEESEVTLHTRLQLSASGEMAYTIVSVSAGEERVHSEGTISFCSHTCRLDNVSVMLSAFESCPELSKEAYTLTLRRLV